MVSVTDVLHHIAQDLREYSGPDQDAAIAEFLAGSSFDMHMSVTTDVEESELHYLEKYGRGNTYYFRCADYGHARNLAAGLYFLLKGEYPDMTRYTGEKFAAGDKLYLFIHLRDLNPVPTVVAERVQPFAWTLRQS